MYCESMCKYVYKYVQEMPEARGLESLTAGITDRDTPGGCWELN